MSAREIITSLFERRREQMEHLPELQALFCWVDLEAEAQSAVSPLRYAGIEARDFVAGLLDLSKLMSIR